MKASEKSSSEQVMQTFDRYVRGWHDGNLQLLSQIYANDAHVSAYWPDPSNGKLLVGWDQIHTDLSDVFAHIHGMDLKFYDRKVNLYGDCAVLTTLWTWNKPPSPPFAHGRASFIFAKEGGRWLVVHEHSSVMPFLPGDLPDEKTN